jgi:hypothetical protein
MSGGAVVALSMLVISGSAAIATLLTEAIAATALIAPAPRKNLRRDSIRLS